MKCPACNQNRLRVRGTRPEKARLRHERARNRAAFRAVPADPDLDPLALVAAGGVPPELGVAAADALARLPADVRADVEAHHLGGRTFAEIGAARGVSGQSAGARVRKALAGVGG